MTVSAPSSRLVPRLALGVVLLAVLACGKRGAAPATSSKTTATRTESEIIGHDSAFGPMYELDSAGRAIPLKKRKP